MDRCPCADRPFRALVLPCGSGRLRRSAALGLTTAYGGGEHELGNYWLGQPMPEPGILFYPMILALRTTPVTLVGLLLALALAVPGPRPGSEWTAHRLGAVGLRVWFGLILSWAAEVRSRPVADLSDRRFTGSLGVGYRVGWAGRRSAGPPRRIGTRGGSGRTVVAGGAVDRHPGMGGVVANRRRYLDGLYPLLGGFRGGGSHRVVGWGEGLAEAAEILDERPAGCPGWPGCLLVRQKRLRGLLPGGVLRPLLRTPLAADSSTAMMWIGLSRTSTRTSVIGEPVGAHATGRTALQRGAAKGVRLAAVYAWPKPFADNDVPADWRWAALAWVASGGP